MNGTGFALRAPWYVRERGGFDLRDPRALRPALQKYENAGFVDRVLTDPCDSLQFDDDDRYTYPIPLTPTNAHGRERFATHTLVGTDLRKLYQPSHERYYTLVVEVFCDQPGLPRAGSHDEIEVGFVMRRRRHLVVGDRQQVRRLARNLVVRLAREQHGFRPATSAADATDLLWADLAFRRGFYADNAALLDGVSATEQVQGWMVNAAGGVWRDLDAPAEDDELARTEEEFPMWRLPPRTEDCAAASTRSLWFGVIPTFSGEHWIDQSGAVQPKLDDHEIYEAVCFVRRPRPPGQEHCPPDVWEGAPSEPFRLAAPFDPDGTKNASVTITLPDLRRLAARAGQRLGPGGVRIVTPPDSALPPVPFGSIPGGSATVGAGGQICSFAIELFFIIAFFLFLMFLPILVFMFQLWWMLALRFCIPPSASFDLLADFFADGGVVADFGLAAHLDAKIAFDVVVGLPAGEDADGDPLPGAGDLAVDVPFFAADPTPAAEPSRLEDLVAAMDPELATDPVTPLPTELRPDDPLCR